MKTYNDAIYRLRSLNNMKHKLRRALGNVGIYLPIGASMLDVLYSVYFYYMFNLFGNNNSNWKEEYFPLDGIGLQSFVETSLTGVNANKMFKDIADEIEGVVYPPTTEQQEHTEDTVLNRGILEHFIGYGGNGVGLKSRIEKVSNNTINTDDLLINTRNILEKLLSLWEWRKSVVNGTRRKRKEDRQTPVIEENALLDDILFELQKEPMYRLPNLKIGEVKLTEKNLDIHYNMTNWNYQHNIIYPCTIYCSPRPGYYSSIHLDTNEKMLFEPKNWTYSSTLDINNIRPNTKIELYYGYKNSNNGQVDYSSDFPGYYQRDSFVNYSWIKRKQETMNISSVKSGENINIAYKDKYNGIYEKRRMSIYAYSYLGWKPEIFLYSKATPKACVVPDDYRRGMLDSPMDHMNLLDNDDFGNLGLTILVPSVVEKFMKEKAINLRELNNTSTTDPSERFNYYEEMQIVNKIRDIETVFLIGIYPVDNDNNIIYKDPIVFQFFSGEQLNDDLGLSFADYRKIKSPTTREKVLLRKYYNLKLGQMFYRNNYSRISTEKKIANITTDINANAGKEVLKNIAYEDGKVGDFSKNLLYLYGRENYMPYVGKTSLQPGQNHNITNPDDNTYIENITLPDTAEYTFNKYGNTKIAIQLYMATNNNSDMNGLDYFKNIKKANGGIIEDNRTNSSEVLVNIPGSYMWLPYRTYSEWIDPTNTRITNKAYPYKDTDIIDAKIPLPSWSSDDVSNVLGMSYATEPVIIDCNKSNEYNAPWLDKRNAPYVSKVVTEDFDYYQPSGSETYEANYTTMSKGIYIKIPNDLSLYMLNDESVKKYVKRKAQNKEEIVLEDREFYGRIKREKYIRVIKNALLGIAVNYNPSSNNKTGIKKPRWFRTYLTNNKLFTRPEHFDIIEYDGELYIRINGRYFEDLEYAGLGKFGTIKIRLIFRNEFFRSDDPKSPLNYKYVPPTGDVQLLREIAGQRIKLYRGGILAHPTDYVTKGDRRIERNVFDYMEDILDVSSTKEVAYKHAYTKGVPVFAMDGDTLVSPDNASSFIFEDDNSVYDIISIEMDYPHWQELQVNNIERSPISSMETDTNEMSLPIPVNIPDLENFDFLEYNIMENSYAMNYQFNNMSYYISSETNSVSISPKLNLCKPDGNSTNQEYIDFYRMLNFWYTFRPKVKFFNKLGEDSGTNIYVEDYNEWRTRILAENRDYFNKKNMKVSTADNREIDLEDVFNIRCYENRYSIHDGGFSDVVRGYNKDPNSKNLYNIMKYIILNHTIYIESGNSNDDFIKEKFNINNKKRAKFGGYILDKLLYSDWVFTYRKGDCKRIDDIMRQSANDTALYLFNMWYYTISEAKRTHENNINAYSADYMSHQDIYPSGTVNYAFEKLLTEFIMSKTGAPLTSGTYNIYSKESGETAIPGEKRLIDFKANNNSTLKFAYEKGKKSQASNNVYNVWNSRIYKGDNRKLDTKNAKAKLRRGFRMGDKTPDNPFMGFSMPATTNPDLVPDYIHLLYCDIYWKDFDKTQHELIDTEASIGFDITPDKNTVLGTAGLTYDFTGFIEKYHLNEWKAKGKHVIFRILVDEPTNERHKDCPEYIKGEYYDNKYGKGFSPNFNDGLVKFHYKHAMLGLGRWINEHLDFDKLLYTIEMPLGISGSGYMVLNGIIWHIPSINEVYNDVYNGFTNYNASLIGDIMVNYKFVFSSSILIDNGIVANRYYGWSCSNLGNREYFETWMKYNMYGTDYAMGKSIAGGAFYGGSMHSNFSKSNRNKFKGFEFSHNGYSGAIRSDLSMDELMKPENFRELLYEMKTITPMYVIGYVDKEKYPEQYETLMNEMGYKYTITSAVIEDGYLKVYYSNEGKNGIKSIYDYATLSVSLKFKNKLKDTNIDVTTQGIDRIRSGEELNVIIETSNDLGITKINMGDVKMFRTNNPEKNPVVYRPYLSGSQFIIKKSIEEAYGKDMVDDVYLELKLRNLYVNDQGSYIKLANVNRDTEINLTDSGLLNMFISNYEITGRQTGLWFDTMYMNHIKIDDNGWI